MIWSRRAEVALLVALLALLVTACASQRVASQASRQAAEPAGRPQNIIIILADDLGFSDLGAFGSEIATPNLDRLALGGVRLIDFHTTAKCFPSRASLLTGLYADEVGRGRSARTPMVGGVTLAESLGAAGYRTLMVGKHHGVTHPMDRGFERYWGLRDGAANFLNPGTRARPGEPEPARKRAEGRWWCFDRHCQQGYLPENPDFYATDAFTDVAIEMIDGAVADGAPFFLYLSYTAPHDPLQAPQRNIEAYRGVYDGGYEAIAAARYRRQRDMGLIDGRYPRPPLDSRDWATLAAAERADQAARMQVYAAMIDRLDENIGRLIALLERHDILDDTLIVFSSDNGASAERVLDDGQEIGAAHPVGSVGRWASLGPDWARVANTPFRFYKNESFHGGTAAATFVHWPAGGVPAGEIRDGPTHLIDIHPTLLALTGQSFDPTLGPGPASPPLRGRDLTETLLTGKAGAREGYIFNRWQTGRMVRTERWKLVSRIGESGPGPWQLYDMQSDRTETRDLAARHADIVAELATAYTDWLAQVAKP